MMTSEAFPVCSCLSTRLWIAVVLVGLGIWNTCPASAQTQAITDGSFEAGGSAWSPSGTVISSGCCPRTGTRYAVMGDVNNAFDAMWQQFTIPSNATYCELSFWRSITSSETSTTTANDVLNVTLQNSSGQYLATVAVRSNLYKQASAYPYVQEFINLTAYKGQTLRLHFFATTNATLPTTFRIDDVSVIYTLPVQRSLSINGQNAGGTIYLTSVPTDIFGNVTLPTPNTFTYNDGQSVYLIASQTAPNGNHFWKWILDGTDIGYSYVSPTFTMNSNRSIVAAFQLPPPPSLTGPGSPGAPGPQLSTLTPTFTWNSVAGASRYGLYISKFPFDGNLVYQNDFVSGTSLMLPAGYLVNGSQYRWDMGTYNASGQLGPISSEFYFQSPQSTPTISSVSPNPVTGSNSEQPFTINGSGFVNGANITLRDLTAGQTFPDRMASFFSSVQIVINPNFTTAAHSWSVEVINLDGGTTDQFNFSVIAPTVQRTLSVAAETFGTSAPISGVFISAIPADVNGKNLDDTPFDLLYNNAQSVQLVAAATAPNGYEFLAWLLDGNEIGYSFMSEPITMDANHTATAVYSPPVVWTLTVESGPDPGVAVIANQVGIDGRNSGNTTFDLYYEDNASVCLTAPSSYNGKDFVKWQIDGVDSPDGCVVMNADHTLTAIYESVNPPAAPFLENVTDAGTGTDIVVSWSHVNPSEVSFFRVEWGLSPGDLSEGSKDVNSGPDTDYRTTIPGLVEHTPYYVAIRAFDAATSLWSATAMWLSPVRPTVPVVLVHGWNTGSPETWDAPGTTDDFAGWLSSAGFNHVWIPALAPCGGTDEEDFALNAITLGLFTNDHLQELTDFAEIPVTHVDIVAHSMGGLVSRRVVSNPQTYGLQPDFARRLIMLGTPNMGHWLGSVACAIPSSEWISAIGCVADFCNFCNPASCEMSSGNISGDGGFNDNTPNNASTEYAVVAGSKCGQLGREEARLITTQAYAWDPLPLPPVDPQTAVVVSDCFVPTLSALALDISTMTPVLNWNYTYVRPYDHTELPRTKDLFDQVIEPVLLGNPPPNDEWPVPTPLLGSKRSVDNLLPHLTALGLWDISEQSWTEDSILVGSVDAAYFAVAVSGVPDSPELEVVSPASITIDSLIASSDSVTYSYFCQGALGEIGVQGPEPGYWKVRVRARSVQSTTANCILMFGVKTSERMIVEIDPLDMFTGDTMTIRAKLEPGGTQSALQAVNCNIAMAAESLHAFIALSDDGEGVDSLALDGVYSGAFVGAVYPGLYSLVLQGKSASSPGDTLTWLSIVDKQVEQDGNPCTCQCHADPQCDSVTDIFDVVLTIEVAFRDGIPIEDTGQGCSWVRSDVDCSGVTDIFDVVRIINVAFRGGDAAIEFCPPCSVVNR